MMQLWWLSGCLELSIVSSPCLLPVPSFSCTWFPFVPPITSFASSGLDGNTTTVSGIVESQNAILSEQNSENEGTSWNQKTKLEGNCCFKCFSQLQRQDKNLWEEGDYPVRHSPITSPNV